MAERYQSLFDKLEKEAFRGGVPARSKESAKWFQERLKDMKNISRTALLKDPALQSRQRFGVGNLYMYFYDPKHAKTLPYYDMFPLTIMVGPAPGGFYGLNMHYVPPPARAQLYDALLDTTNNKRYNESTRFKLTYDLLQGSSKMKWYKPAFKHYLSKHVASKIALVEPPEWEIALFMPTEHFQKASRSKVWKDSRKIAMG